MRAPVLMFPERTESAVNKSDNHHWNGVYRSKPVDEVSWFEPTPAASLNALNRTGASPGSSLIDVGCGASALVDRLIDLGWRDLTVLDIAADALEISKSRLGDRANDINWLVANISAWMPNRQYDVWHDRAVFHFLTTPAARLAYRQALEAALAVGGHAIIATFAPDGPEQCSGLPVCRYSAESLRVELGNAFELIHDWKDTHHTPGGRDQSFTWTIFRKRIGT